MPRGQALHLGKWNVFADLRTDEEGFEMGIPQVKTPGNLLNEKKVKHLSEVLDVGGCE